MNQDAVIIANRLFRTSDAKTSHGLVRGPSRYRIVAVIDPSCAGDDAGVVLDGRSRGIPVVESIAGFVAECEAPPQHCIVGVATVGGLLPADVRSELLSAARLGMTLVNGLHTMLGDDEELAALVAEGGGEILDLRRPRPVADLRFWSGEITELETPRLAVLGTDCAIGKRTTASMLVEGCRARGIRAEMIYTGQTGWLQGFRHGFILDATPNDFVCGELERAILECDRLERPDLIVLEGQAALRHPAGPCGSELIISGGATHVVLQHQPGREYYEDLEDLGLAVPPLVEEIELIRLLGAEVCAVTLHEGALHPSRQEEIRERLAEELRVPVLFPLSEGMAPVVEHVESLLQRRRAE